MGTNGGVVVVVTRGAPAGSGPGEDRPLALAFHIIFHSLTAFGLA